LVPKVQQIQMLRFLPVVLSVLKVLEDQQARVDRMDLASLCHPVLLVVQETLMIQTILMGQPVR